MSTDTIEAIKMALGISFGAVIVVLLFVGSLAQISALRSKEYNRLLKLRKAACERDVHNMINPARKKVIEESLLLDCEEMIESISFLHTSN